MGISAETSITIMLRCVDTVTSRDYYIFMVSPLTKLPLDAYVPILKGKAAELGAVSTAPKERLVPLLEFIDPVKASSALPKAWNTADGAVWVQMLNVEGINDPKFAGQIADFFDRVREKVCAVPVVTTTETPDTFSAIASVIAKDGRGVILRIDVEDLIDSEVNTADDITAVLEQLNIASSQVALVVDGGTLTGSQTIQATLAIQALSALNLREWMSVVLSFSAFPEELGKVAARNSVTPIPRVDAKTFVTVRNKMEGSLIYGDYAVGTPRYGSAPFAPIPNIRYATNDAWQVHRGGKRSSPSTQYVALAKDIVNASYYGGKNFSPADQKLNDVASKVGGPGNATIHLRIAASRHLHLVLWRLANLGAP